MELDGIIDSIVSASGELFKLIELGQAIPPLGIRRSARLPWLAALRQAAERPILLITDRNDHALTLADELALWAPKLPLLFFPEPTPLFYENATWGLTTRRERLMVLSSLAGYHIPGGVKPPPPIIITPVRALMVRTLPRREFLKILRTIKVGQVVQPDELLRAWVAMGYEHTNIVVSPGQFSRRGGILDIWTPSAEQPVRIELFGDEIDTLRCFDPATQRTINTIERLPISPAREFITPDTETLQKLAIEPGSLSEFYIPVLHPEPASLLDYLPSQSLVLVDDEQAVRDSVQEVEEQAVGLRRDYIKDSELPEDFPIPYLTWSELEDTLAGKQAIDLGLPVNNEALPGRPTNIADSFLPGVRFAGQLKPLMEHLDQCCAQSEPIIIVSRQSARLQELWKEHNPFTPSSECLSFYDASLSEGLTFAAPGEKPIHLFTDGEIFGWRRPELRQRPRPMAEAPEAAYADFEPGDWVVHVDYGIGRFIGLVERSVDGIEREYLAVEYAEGDQLFVPVYQADRLTRYIGHDSHAPTPTRLGSPEWRTTKSHVKEAVEEVAQDLLDLYAHRNVVEGHAFGKDAPWQKELEASFPYIETTDQLRVISEVKQDMEAVKPMDRLICGDVGYGKTEVALRAAFKAVMDGRQVAILVPTTVLAQQHYHTFTQRLAPFPVEVEMLSRFRTPQQQKDILEKLSIGKVDIIIGTHRLLQGDVVFKDMGLLIIDEEQRFGVTHKETLKKMRTEVDVLTLTATPIPRTLYMTLTGVRDISTINTPPEERLPIITHVGPYSPTLVRQAILRELERGGQVFFVHNRVQTIGAMRFHLEKLVPEARVVVAHGQMAEDQLSQRMEQFSNGNVDILLSTSIIESGLDIPNANTLIVDRADTFGLAQLYQLRGRVGRGAQRAYAYFFRHKHLAPTIEGRQRLETIAENTQLGAGYSIAMRDLEIRGAGDILGTRQHGYIASVGFHLYTRLLADAVQRLRVGKPVPVLAQALQADQAAPGLPISVDLPLAVSLPASYIPDRQTRTRLYRRLADLRTQDEIDALEGEFIDRFGPLPAETRNLFYQLKVKMLADKVGLASISAEGGQIILRYPPLPEGETSRPIPELGGDIRTGKNAIWIPIAALESWQDQLIVVLHQLETD
ncbi:MAG: transcription-repair coupling factor [Anaerolineae bacterium]|nr:transcription-repair coupling factor [Anaerolineae bacterium]